MSLNNHVRKVNQMLDAGEITTKDLTRLNIYHEDRCALLNKRGPCNCDPVIEVTKETHGRTFGRLHNKDQ